MAEQFLDRPDVISFLRQGECSGRVKFVDSSVFQRHSVKVAFKGVIQNSFCNFLKRQKFFCILNCYEKNTTRALEGIT